MFRGTDTPKEEERRIWYVALTRAKRKVYVIVAADIESHSPFVDELQVQNYPLGVPSTPVFGDISPVLAATALNRPAIPTKSRSPNMRVLTQPLTDELWRRHRRYEKSGITAVWLLRQPEFPVSPEFPAACIGGTIEDDTGLEILMPDTLIERAAQRKEQWMWEQALKPEDFFDGVFDGRFLFGLPAGTPPSFGSGYRGWNARNATKPLGS